MRVSVSSDWHSCIPCNDALTRLRTLCTKKENKKLSIGHFLTYNSELCESYYENQNRHLPGRKAADWHACGEKGRRSNVMYQFNCFLSLFPQSVSQNALEIRAKIERRVSQPMRKISTTEWKFAKNVHFHTEFETDHLGVWTCLRWTLCLATE